MAQRGALLFFLLNSLSKVHAFYQFSLNAFVTVYGRGLDTSPGGKRKQVRGGSAPAGCSFEKMKWQHRAAAAAEAMLIPA